MFARFVVAAAVAALTAVAVQAQALDGLTFAARAEGGTATIDALNDTGVRQYCTLGAVYRGLKNGADAIYTFNCAAAIETGAHEAVCRKEAVRIVDARPTGEIKANCRPATPEELETRNN